MSYKLQKYLEFKKNISNKFRKKVKKNRETIFSVSIKFDKVKS